MRREVRLLSLFAVAVACLPVAPAAAIPFPVESTADSGNGTLRWAIEEANDLPGADSIPIEVTGTVNLETALPTVAEDVAIAGPGAAALTVRRNAADPFRIFHFGDGVTASLAGLTISDGIDVTVGGGILNDSGSLTLTGVVVAGNEVVGSGGSLASVHGGGIASYGPLTVRESVIQGNTATAQGATNTVAGGGGISSLAALTVERSTVSGNLAQAIGEGGMQAEATGGGIRAIGDSATVELSTVSGNSATATKGTSQIVASGGGIRGTHVTLTSATVTGNEIASEKTAAGANLDIAGTTLLRNTIVSRPLGGAKSCSGSEGSGGFNLDEDASCGLGMASDRSGVAAGLDPVLRANGGPTPTHALLENSPALDRGSAFGSAVDQRGLPRPIDLATVSNAEGGDGSDVGAFELQALTASPPAAIAVELTAGDRVPPNTRIVRAPGRVTFLRLAKFTFASTEPQSSFQCKVDGGKWRGCRSPWKRKVGVGKHVFKVRASDRFGNVDPTPARFGWRVKALGG
ncbi:MAG TPA: choice-of-anchor Q domain-containing protein [Solirubrobacterales bacterium]|nr:choice-of-anchor Q domain-containing protein [Solirubrobacterales bacterium]